MQRADRIESAVAEPSLKLETRRTGVAFLCLIVATNFVPWMPLAEAGFDLTRPPSGSETSISFKVVRAAAVSPSRNWQAPTRTP